MNSSGKVMTIFIIIIAILLISLTAISLFFFKKESDRREQAEVKLEKSMSSEIELESEVENLTKQNFLLTEKNKEADDRINSLMDELELEAGLKEELKKETVSVREQFQIAQKEKESIQLKLDNLASESKHQSVGIEEELQNEISVRTEIEAKLDSAMKEQQRLQNMITQLRLGVDGGQEQVDVFDQPLFDRQVNLDKIVVIPNEIPEGRILTVDEETEFVIVDIGKKDGVKEGKILSVYRGQDYLGDIRITRVQPEMSAADFIPPFSSKRARKNDQVITKQ